VTASVPFDLLEGVLGLIGRMMNSVLFRLRPGAILVEKGCCDYSDRPARIQAPSWSGNKRINAMTVG